MEFAAAAATPSYSSRVLSSRHFSPFTPRTATLQSPAPPAPGLLKLNLFGTNKPTNASLHFPTTQSTLKDHAPLMSGSKAPDFELSNLTALSPLDGRYWNKVKDLTPFLSEYGLIYYRVLVEVEWLLKLSQIPQVHDVPQLSDNAVRFLKNLVDGFGLDDALEVKSIERVTNHDVKAVEYFLKKKCQSEPEISQVIEFFHFACTSEDINNLAHGLMLKHAMDDVVFPVMDQLIETISNLAKDNASIPMLSCTHGQTASPTTLGKEMVVFAARLWEQRQEILQVKPKGKFAGAVGNYNAHLSAYPGVNGQRSPKNLWNLLGCALIPMLLRLNHMTTWRDFLCNYFV